MDENVKKVKKVILDAIDTLIDKKLDNLYFDKTFIAPITNKTTISSTEYKYEVVVSGSNKYYVTSNVNHSIGERVKIKFPNNNPMNAYIEEMVIVSDDGIDIMTLLEEEY